MTTTHETDEGVLVTTEEVKLRTSLPGLLLSLRPHQWVKNTLVFGGLVFSHSLFDAIAVQKSLAAFGIFCMASSAVYLLNDLRDLATDRLHPMKCLRPLAAGLVSPMLAVVLMILLAAAALTWAAFLGSRFTLVLGIYFLLNIGYSLGLKRVAILDVMIIASGFVLRAVAGAAAIGVPPSPWLILSTLMLALLVGFGKRRQELVVLQDGATRHRASLEGYTLPFLDMMMSIAGGASVVTYALYTMADETVARFGSRRLIATVPWVIYGVFRYLYLAHHSAKGDDPARLFVTDPPTLVNVVMWIAIVAYLVYAPIGWQVW
jgi:4-hydroxybenzoate polyprenyltransferase